MKKIYLFFIIITLFSFCVNGEGILDEGKNIYSDYVYMVNLDTGKVVYEYDADTITYPASLTKIMTCILAIENCESIDETVVIPSGIFGDVYAQGGAHISLKTGEEISLRDLIKATMIRSSCDTATAIACHISGSVEAFSVLMNSKAKEIGCNSTHFVNAHGLHDDNHYTTAKDIYLIAEYALKNKDLCDIISEYTCTIAPTNKSEERVLYTTIEIENPNNENYYEYVTGVKSGFTDEAGRCLITKATKDNENYLLVTLGANRDRWYNSNMAFTDAVTLFEYAFAEYDIKEVLSSDTPLTVAEVSNGEAEIVTLYAKDGITTLAAIGDVADITFNLPEEIKAPISAGEIVGTFTLKIANEEFTGELVSKEDIKKIEVKKGLAKLNHGNTFATILDSCSLIIFLITIVIIVFFVLRIRKSKKK